MCLFLTLAQKGNTFNRMISVEMMCVSGLVRRPTVLGFIVGKGVCSMLVYCCSGFPCPLLMLITVLFYALQWSSDHLLEANCWVAFLNCQYFKGGRVSTNLLTSM